MIEASRGLFATAELLVCPYFKLGDAISVNHITAAVAGDVLFLINFVCLLRC